jgi:hypothetical protein
LKSRLGCKQFGSGKAPHDHQRFGGAWTHPSEVDNGTWKPIRL